MPRKHDHRKRRLWLGLHVAKVPPGTTRGQLIDELLDSIQRGDYELPRGWSVRLRWRNREDEAMKIDQFGRAMYDSAKAGTGFDLAVAAWLDRQRAVRR